MSARPPPTHVSTKSKCQPKKCKFYLQGKCIKGDFCKFVHEATPDKVEVTLQVRIFNISRNMTFVEFEDLKVGSASTSQVTLRGCAPTFVPGRAGSELAKHLLESNQNESNIFSQSALSITSDSESPTAGPSKKFNRNIPCRYWKSAGKCAQGEKCNFRHDPQV